jgi:hypothetical protein
VTFEDFLPYVHPSVLACPVETVVHNVRLAAIEFCRRSCAWREDLDTVLADGFSTEFELALDDQVELVKLYAVRVNGQEIDLCESIEGRRLIEDECSLPFAFTDSRKTLTIFPLLEADDQIDVTLALKPSMTAFSFPDELFAHHVGDIAEGALAKLMRMPRCDWTDAMLAIDYERRFISATNRAGRQAARGYGRTKRRPTTRFF